MGGERGHNFSGGGVFYSSSSSSRAPKVSRKKKKKEKKRGGPGGGGNQENRGTKRILPSVGAAPGGRARRCGTRTWHPSGRPTGADAANERRGGNARAELGRAGKTRKAGLGWGWGGPTMRWPTWGTDLRLGIARPPDVLDVPGGDAQEGAGAQARQQRRARVLTVEFGVRGRDLADPHCSSQCLGPLRIAAASVRSRGRRRPRRNSRLRRPGSGS